MLYSPGPASTKSPWPGNGDGNGNGDDKATVLSFNLRDKVFSTNRAKNSFIINYDYRDN